MAGVARCAWQAWHLVTWTVTWRGRRGTFSHGLSLCVAGVARTGLGDATFACGSEDLEVPCEVTLCMFICLTFSKQLEIYIVHGIWSYSFSPHHCVGFLFLDLHPPSASASPIARRLPITSHTYKSLTHKSTYTQITHIHLHTNHSHTNHSQTHMDRHFAWQAWHFLTCTCTLRGRRGTCGTGLELVTRWGAACRR